ncbi:MAG TPA: hypothetical protein DDW70_02010 [Rikenellaceae bacterium]|nr:hypothetical protein [Rikenellaceae bacterium]
MLSLIAVLGPSRELGLRNGLLWHISEDLRHFKALTLGHTVIMGRRTYESLGKPLPGRNNIVISRSGEKLEEVLAAINDQTEVFIIGGAQIYRQTMPMADRLYITHVQAPLPPEGADVFFPPIDPLQWREISRQDFSRGVTFLYPFSFVTYERRQTPSLSATPAATRRN